MTWNRFPERNAFISGGWSGAIGAGAGTASNRRREGIFSAELWRGTHEAAPPRYRRTARRPDTDTAQGALA